MTDAKVLAAALVEAGYIEKTVYSGRYYYEQDPPIDAEEILTDWRVAGKVLEGLSFGHSFFIEGDEAFMNYGYTLDLEHCLTASSTTKPLPRAIIEAWYEAK